MTQNFTKTVTIIVAHPDDETLWAGGMILSHPTWEKFIVCLCRGKDHDRAPRFYKALKVLESDGIMGDMDDGPDQIPLNEKEVEQAVLDILPPKHFDLVISHNPSGEYTRHLRHEEISKAVITLWYTGKISATELWTFAYEDGNKEYYPRPVKNAAIYRKLSKRVWLKKYNIITETYGFKKDSFEAETTPRTESFWQFRDPKDAKEWLNKGGVIK